MALAGIHAECSTRVAMQNGYPVPAQGPLVWSENVTSAGTTTNSVPSTGGPHPLLITITAAADSFIDIGPSPDATSSKKRFCPAGIPRDFSANPGDKVAWVAA